MCLAVYLSHSRSHHSWVIPHLLLFRSSRSSLTSETISLCSWAVITNYQKSPLYNNPHSECTLHLFTQGWWHDPLFRDYDAQMTNFHLFMSEWVSEWACVWGRCLSPNSITVSPERIHILQAPHCHLVHFFFSESLQLSGIAGHLLHIDWRF